ncbi:MAG: asparagine synthase (glutamine-hydrolyzing) [Blastocatellia bacterium]|nr:MAG: asparagine synthase (glutamine-hydrolyzing) [Blastocatellia bacterium]
MCGICGVWGDNNASGVRAMVSALRRRGPDDCGVLTDANVTLGMTRLAIIDTSHSGHQPMVSADGKIAIVYNGELYNFREERSLLEARGYGFKSASDTEVVLSMYEHYGDDFLFRMRGMFAVAIYDKRRGPRHERLLLARDQMGIKPLLYTRVGKSLVFASEIKALLASGLVTPEVDPVSLRLLLTHGSVYQPGTILKHVKMLLPAHRLICEGDREERIERYWSLGLNRRSDFRTCPYEEQIEEVANALRQSVRLQMVSDVSLGAFLSGGVDSSLLVAMMAREVSDHRVKTFSVGFEAEGSHIDETDDAECTARFIGTDHTRVVVTGNDVRARIKQIAYDLDQPSVDGVNSYFVSMAARQAVTVAISGTGADELFAGYPWFQQMAIAQTQLRSAPWRSVAEAVLAAITRQRVLDPLVTKPGGYRLGRLREKADFLSRYYSTNPTFEAAWTARLIQPDLRSAAQAGRSPHYDLHPLDELADGTVLERVTGVCLRGYTTNQLLRDIDAASMAHSLEVRVPYLDLGVADLVLSLPDTAKMNTTPSSAATVGSYRDFGTKRILLDIGKRMLPEGFDTKAKRGFGMPFKSWLNGPLREVMMDTLSERKVKARGLLNPEMVSAVKDHFFSGRVEWCQPWLLMMIELWASEVLDKSARASIPQAAHASVTVRDLNASTT